MPLDRIDGGRPEANLVQVPRRNPRRLFIPRSSDWCFKFPHCGTWTRWKYPTRRETY